MEKETAHHLQDIINNMLQYWQIYLFVIGSIIGSIMFFLRKTFATTAAVHDLRMENMLQHEEIKKVMSDNHRDILNKIMELHK